MPIQDHSAQLDYVKGDNELTASNSRAQNFPEVTLIRICNLIISPKNLHTDKDMRRRNHLISCLDYLSYKWKHHHQSQEDEIMTPNHSQKKWNSGEHSSKATKGFKKLLFFGRKSRK
ncbi:hypothetical protein RHGRI_018458 [Rhododendron griersonianum]|uniref:Uncharacterized protein n=1 Tax=Rhododendron griersonianum TaxID=479676 RepID=A0AAV6K1H9_9ERIC|nr:hypothetical protein RHGRI_018458 [Rhododendron griersonianum]